MEHNGYDVTTIRHAAHCPYTGRAHWDIEQITVPWSERHHVRPYEYVHGHVKDGVQYAVCERTVEPSPERCKHCRHTDDDDDQELIEHEVKEGIIEGIATAAWAMAWADHVEQERCHDISGCEITEVMPEVPNEAYYFARVFCQDFWRKNDRRSVVDACLEMGAREEAGLWGHYAYMESIGSGVSWADSHEFAIRAHNRLPSTMHDLDVVAADTCNTRNR